MGWFVHETECVLKYLVFNETGERWFVNTLYVLSYIHSCVCTVVDESVSPLSRCFHFFFFQMRFPRLSSEAFREVGEIVQLLSNCQSFSSCTASSACTTRRSPWPPGPGRQGQEASSSTSMTLHVSTHDADKNNVSLTRTLPSACEQSTP